MAFKGYRVVVITPMRDGAFHRTPWSIWMTNEDAVQAWAAWRNKELGRWFAVESKRGALSQLIAPKWAEVSA